METTKEAGSSSTMCERVSRNMIEPFDQESEEREKGREQSNGESA